MTQTIISNEDIRGVVGKRIFEILFPFATPRPNELVDQILSIENLAVVDRDAKPPIRFIHPDDSGVLSYEKCKQDMVKEGWVKECL